MKEKLRRKTEQQMLGLLLFVGAQAGTMAMSTTYMQVDQAALDPDKRHA